MKNYFPATLFWSQIAGTLGGPLETRGVRVTWEPLEDKGRVKGTLKLGSGNLSSKIAYPGLIQSQGRRNVFQKTDFTLEDSKWMISDILRKYWDAITPVEGHVVKHGFIRAAPELGNDKVIVEFGSPNIAKPLHMGHLRSLVTGHFTARICKAAGHDVTSICFLGRISLNYVVIYCGVGFNVEIIFGLQGTGVHSLVFCRYGEMQRI